MRISANSPPVYFDCAATAWPRPPAVTDAVQHALLYAGGNPGRGGHPLAERAAAAVFSARVHAAELFSAIPDTLDSAERGRAIFRAARAYRIHAQLHPRAQSRDLRPAPPRRPRRHQQHGAQCRLPAGQRAGRGGRDPVQHRRSLARPRGDAPQLPRAHPPGDPRRNLHARQQRHRPDSAVPGARRALPRARAESDCRRRAGLRHPAGLARRRNAPPDTRGCSARRARVC